MKKTFLVALAGLTVVFGSSCLNDDNNNVVPPVASFGLVNASPTSPGLDVVLNSDLVTENLTYGNDDGYYAVMPGTYVLKMNETGTVNTLATANVSMAGGVAYSIFASDSASHMKLSMAEDKTTTPPSDSIRVRFLNFSSDAPSADLLKDGEVLIADRGYNGIATQPSQGDFITLKSGTFNFTVQKTGAADVLVPATSLTLNGGKIYTLYLRGFVAGSGPQTLTLDTLLHNQ